MNKNLLDGGTSSYSYLTRYELKAAIRILSEHLSSEHLTSEYLTSEYLTSDKGFEIITINFQYVYLFAADNLTTIFMLNGAEQGLNI